MNAPIPGWLKFSSPLGPKGEIVPPVHIHASSMMPVMHQMYGASPPMTVMYFAMGQQFIVMGTPEEIQQKFAKAQQKLLSEAMNVRQQLSNASAASGYTLTDRDALGTKPNDPKLAKQT